VYSCGCNGRTVESLVNERHNRSIIDVTSRHGEGISRILEENGPFDLAVIMAGTNDLGQPKHSILRSVQNLHKLCHNKGVQTVALTVPPNGFSIQGSELPEYRLKWLEANSQLRAWASGITNSPALLINTEELVPFPYKGHHHWERDNLHFSPAGSAALGRRLAPLLAQLLRSSGQAPKTPDDVLFLPRKLLGRQVLRKTEVGKFVAEVEHLKETAHETGIGLGYRRTTQLTDKLQRHLACFWRKMKHAAAALRNEGHAAPQQKPIRHAHAKKQRPTKKATTKTKKKKKSLVEIDKDWIQVRAKVPRSVGIRGGA